MSLIWRSSASNSAGIKHTPILKTETGSYLTFFTGPWGTYVELNERPEPL